MAPEPDWAYTDAGALLFKRDTCSEFHGTNRSRDSICAPSRTLCCIWRSLPFPSCQQYLGRGWCCQGDTADDDCYVDITPSCSQPNAVHCTNLTEGVAEACCPEGTECEDRNVATKTSVRCKMRHVELKRLDAAEESSSSGTGLLDSESTAGAASGGGNNTLGLPPPAGEEVADQGQGMMSAQTVGVVAGAAVGGTLGLVALVLLAFWLFRRQRRRRREVEVGYLLPPSPPHGTQPLSSPPQLSQYSSYGELKRDVGPPGFGPVEMNSDRDRAELMDIGGRTELSERGRERAELPAGI